MGQEARPMRTQMVWLVALAAAAGGGLFVFSQTPGPVQTAPPVVPGTAAPPQSGASKPSGRDLSRFTLVQRQLFASAQRGADWLQRCAGPDRRFRYVACP